MTQKGQEHGTVLDAFVGRWRPIELTPFGRGYVLLGDAPHVTIEPDGSGSFEIGLIAGDLDARHDDLGDAQQRLAFSCALRFSRWIGVRSRKPEGPRPTYPWEGADDLDSEFGRGWFELDATGDLVGRLVFHRGSEHGFRATRRFVGLQLEDWHEATDAQIDAVLRAWADAYGRLWWMDGFAETITWRYSKRMRANLVAADPTTGCIRLHPCVRTTHPVVVRDAVCHELATVAAERLRGPTTRLRDPTWAALVERAGANTAHGHWPAHLRASRGKEPTERDGHYEHVCPICKSVRRARSRLERWRCKTCFEAGEHGEVQTGGLW